METEQAQLFSSIPFEQAHISSQQTITINMSGKGTSSLITCVDWPMEHINRK